MNRVLIISLISLMFFSCKKDKGEEPEAVNEVNPPEKTVDGRLMGISRSTILSNDQNLLIAGDDGSRIFIAKTNLAGDKIWYHKYGNQGEFSVQAITQTSLNEIFVCGRKYSRNTEVFSTMLMKFDNKGSFKWDSTYYFPGEHRAASIVADDDGGVILVTGDFANGGSSVMNLFKVNSSGKVLWKESLNGSLSSLLPRSLINTSDKGFLVTATSIESDDLHFWKTDSLGKVLWQTKLGGKKGIMAFKTIETFNNEFVTCGKQYVSLNGGSYTLPFILRMDAMGNLKWMNHFEEPKYPPSASYSMEGRGIVENKDNTFTLLVDDIEVVLDSTDALPPKFFPKSISHYRMRLFQIDAAGNRVKDHTLQNSKKDYEPLYQSFNIVGAKNGYNITGNFDQSVFIIRANNM